MPYKQKSCTRCHKSFAIITGFSNHPNTLDGKMHICKKCHCKANTGKGFKQRQAVRNKNTDPVLSEINLQIATLEKKKKKYISTNRNLPITWVRAIIDQI